MSIASIYYKDANIILLVLDCENEESLDRAEDYLERIYEETKNTKIFLVINKCDLLPGFEENGEMSEDVKRKCTFYSSILSFAKKNSLQLFWVSAKSGNSVENLFSYLIDNIYNGGIYI